MGFMHIKLLTAIVLCLALAGCKSRKEDPVKTEDDGYSTRVTYPVTVDLVGALNTVDETIGLSTFVEDISYIPIKTTADCLLRLLYISEFDEKEGLFVINDLYQVWTADTSGNILHKIGRRGQGPGEYIQVSNVSVDTQSKSIYVYNARVRNGLKYSYTGKFIKNMFPAPSDSLFTCVMAYSHDNFVAIGAIYHFGYDVIYDCLYGFGVLDTVGNWLDVTPPQVSRLRRDGGQYSQFMNGTFTKYKDHLLFRNFGLCDTVFTEENGRIVPRFLLDYGDEKPDLNELWSMVKETRSRALYKSIVIVGNTYETERYFLIRAGKRDKNYIICHDKYKNNSFALPLREPPGEIKLPRQYMGLYNDLDGGLDYYPVTMSSDGNYWISYVDASVAKEVLTDEYLARRVTDESRERQTKMKDLFATIKEDDNPILVLMKVRNE